MARERISLRVNNFQKKKKKLLYFTLLYFGEGEKFASILFSFRFDLRYIIEFRTMILRISFFSLPRTMARERISLCMNNFQKRKKDTTLLYFILGRGGGKICFDPFSFRFKIYHRISYNDSPNFVSFTSWHTYYEYLLPGKGSYLCVWIISKKEKETTLLYFILEGRKRMSKRKKWKWQDMEVGCRIRSILESIRWTKVFAQFPPRGPRRREARGGKRRRGKAVHGVMRRKSPANLIPARFIWSYFISAFDAALGRHAFKIHYTLAGRAAVTEGGKKREGGGVQR